MKVINLHGIRYILEGDEAEAFKLIGTGRARMGQMMASRINRKVMRSQLCIDTGATVITELNGYIKQCRIYAPPVSTVLPEKPQGNQDQQEFAFALDAYDADGVFRGIYVVDPRTLTPLVFHSKETFSAEMPDMRLEGGVITWMNAFLGIFATSGAYGGTAFGPSTGHWSRAIHDEYEENEDCEITGSSWGYKKPAHIDVDGTVLDILPDQYEYTSYCSAEIEPIGDDPAPGEDGHACPEANGHASHSIRNYRGVWPYYGHGVFVDEEFYGYFCVETYGDDNRSCYIGDVYLPSLGYLRIDMGYAGSWDYGERQIVCVDGEDFVLWDAMGSYYSPDDANSSTSVTGATGGLVLSPAYYGDGLGDYPTAYVYEGDRPRPAFRRSLLWVQYHQSNPIRFVTSAHIQADLYNGDPWMTSPDGYPKYIEYWLKFAGEEGLHHVHKEVEHRIDGVDYHYIGDVGEEPLYGDGAFRVIVDRTKMMGRV